VHLKCEFSLNFALSPFSLYLIVLESPRPPRFFSMRSPRHSFHFPSALIVSGSSPPPFFLVRDFSTRAWFSFSEFSPPASVLLLSGQVHQSVVAPLLGNSRSFPFLSLSTPSFENRKSPDDGLRLCKNSWSLSLGLTPRKCPLSAQLHKIKDLALDGPVIQRRKPLLVIVLA